MTVTFPPSIWAATAPARTPAPALRESAETDVAIVGGGFSGLSTALHLAKRGRKVMVLEGAEVGWGASGRNNGQVIPTLSAVEPDAIVKRFGEAGERFVHLIRDSAAITFDLIRAEGIEAEAEQTGWFQPAHSPGRVRLSEKRVEAWRRFGAPAEFLDRQQTRDLLGSDAWHAGMLNPTGGHINPLALARGLAGAAERAGATIHETTPVQKIEREGERWVLTLPEGRLTARAVVLATQAYTDALAPGLMPKVAKSIVPVLSWQAATEPVGDNLRASIVPGRQAVSDTRADLRFFRYDARNRLVTGGAMMLPVNGEAKMRRMVGEKMAAAFPTMGAPELSYIWNGYIAITPDRWPKVHRYGPDFWGWIGCNGRGVALGVAMGREIAAAVDGVDPDTLALPLSEPQPIPFHAIGRRIAPAVLAWYRRRDKVEPKL